MRQQSCAFSFLSYHFVTYENSMFVDKWLQQADIV